MRGPVALLLLAGAALAGCSTAPSDGGVLPAAATPPGAAVSTPPVGEQVVAPGRDVVTVTTAGPATVVRAGARTTRVPGRWVLPRVVPGGPPDGLNVDGSLVLHEAEPSNGRTKLAVIDTAAARSRIVSLTGRFTYDAWSPNGAVLYLVEHRSEIGPAHYVVRAYDVRRGALREAPVVDKRTLAEDMAGLPLARAMSPDGRVVATLYEPPAGHGHGPFVHVLYAAEVNAVCVDLPPGPTKGWQLEYADGDVLVADPSGRGVHRIDPKSGIVSAVRPT